MAINIIEKTISHTLRKLLKEGNLTEQQKNLWDRYLAFLDVDQLNDLFEIIEQDKDSFYALMSELEANVSSS